ncbi:MAG: alpha/beta fold hydrolase [Rubripirellula sp.]
MNESSAQPNNKENTANPRPVAMDELSEIEVNGTKQWILVRANDRTKPVVLFVHGGPGYPLMWYSRGFDDAFLDDFVVVHWDQRRAGKSYSTDVSVESCTLDQIVEDGLEVTAQLKRKLNVKEVILTGHSWGTMVAANMAERSPDDFTGLVMVGTCADWMKGETNRYNAYLELAKRTDDAASMEKLLKLGPPPHLTWEAVGRFGELHEQLQGIGGTSRKLTMDQFTEAIQKNKEYTGDEILQTLKGMEELMNEHGPFLNSYVLQDEVRELKIPVYFAQGEHDLNTPTDLAKEYFESLIAPRGKYWHQFDGCAHMNLYEDTEQFLAVLKTLSASAE